MRNEENDEGQKRMEKMDWKNHPYAIKAEEKEEEEEEEGINKSPQLTSDTGTGREMRYDEALILKVSE